MSRDAILVRQSPHEGTPRTVATWQAFEQQAFNLIRQIPPGRVSSYGRIAAQIPPPAGMDPNGYRRIAPRKVGTALYNLGRRMAAGRPPADAERLPWHRVLNARGCSSLAGAAAELQRSLLEDEGLRFNEQGCVDMARHAWDFPPDPPGV